MTTMTTTATATTALLLLLATACAVALRWRRRGRRLPQSPSPPWLARLVDEPSDADASAPPVALAEPLQAKRQLFDRIYAGTTLRTTKLASVKDVGEMRDAPGGDSLCAFTYGEIDFNSFVSILALAAPRAGQVFYDLGSGSGRAVICAALVCPELKAAVGIELLPRVHALAVDAARRYREARASPCEVRLVQGDFTSMDWSDADVVFSSTTCFPHGVLRAIADAAGRLRPGARVVTLTQPLQHHALRVRHKQHFAMSWGLACAFFHERV